MVDVRWLACLSLVSACGGSAPTPAPRTPVEVAQPPVARAFPVYKRGSDKIVVEVSEAGGVLELDNGAKLDIPAGALAEEVTLTFAAGARTTAFSNRDFERAVGPTLEIAPQLTLAAPLTVSIPLTQLPEGFAADDLALGIEVLGDQQRLGGQGTQTRWDYTAASSEHGRAQARLSNLSGLRVQFLVSKND